MSQHLDRIRSKAGLSAAAAAATRDRRTTAPASSVATLLAATSPARTGMSDLRLAAFVTGALSLVAAGGHRAILERVAVGDGNVLRHWAVKIMTVGHVEVWGPWLAGLAAIVLLVAAVRTNGFRSGTLADTIATAAGTAVGGVASLPLAIAAVYGAVVLVVFIAICILAAVALLMLLAAVLSDL